MGQLFSGSIKDREKSLDFSYQFSFDAPSDDRVEDARIWKPLRKQLEGMPKEKWLTVAFNPAQANFEMGMMPLVLTRAFTSARDWFARAQKEGKYGKDFKLVRYASRRTTKDGKLHMIIIPTDKSVEDYLAIQ